jgi:hypothetical protein
MECLYEHGNEHSCSIRKDTLDRLSDYQFFK